MTTVLRIVRLYALAIWVGGLVFFGFVAAMAFKTLPDAHDAGLVVRGALIDLHRIGMAAGLVYLLCTLALLATQRDTHPIRAAELVLVLIMMALTGYSEFSVIPRMEADRASLGGDVTKASDDAPAKKHFDRLHNVSVKVEGGVLVCGLLLLAMAGVHGRDDFDRFA
jgi:ABC-type transport system involved in cytochrome bd biosynthesis fused ATPase/permease subunit